MTQSIEKYEKLWIFHRLTSNKRQELYDILGFLLKQNKGVRSSEIADHTSIPKSVVDRRLMRLRAADQLDVIWANMKYIKDLKDGSASFP